MASPRRLRLDQDPAEAIVEAFVQAAAAGQLLVFPTDTVYGLGARADRPEVVQAVFAAKQRPAELPLPVLVASRERLEEVVSSWPEAAEALAAAFWPGPLTLVLPRHQALPPVVVGGGDTVGVRMPDHPALLSWLRACPFPLAVTSANLSGRSEAVAADEIAPELLAAAGLVVAGGRCAGGQPSTVVDLTAPEPRVLRAGPISEAQIRDCWPAGAGRPLSEAERIDRE